VRVCLQRAGPGCAVPFIYSASGRGQSTGIRMGTCARPRGGRVVRRWSIHEEIVVPSEYRVVLVLADGGAVGRQRHRWSQRTVVWDALNRSVVLAVPLEHEDHRRRKREGIVS